MLLIRILFYGKNIVTILFDAILTVTTIRHLWYPVAGTSLEFDTKDHPLLFDRVQSA